MPGKHAPSSPWSFYRSLARAAGGVAGVVLLVVVLAVVAFGGRGDKKDPRALDRTSSPTPTPTAILSPTASLTVSPTPDVRPPSQVRVKVLNGNGRPGLARRTGDRLTAAGYNVVDTGNTGRPASVSTIYYQPGFEKEALALQRAFPAFTSVKPAADAPSDVTVDTSIVTVLGADWPRE